MLFAPERGAVAVWRARRCPGPGRSDGRRYHHMKRAMCGVRNGPLRAMQEQTE
ncbi:hypothetical protein FTUN_2306 [Frigoriglobus tundricola]|uniref:Uncharacterized protein n=1 Tax=Frigoriglobus tundricola TaxID=2774151 RepID=A0A6M5YNA5_9BACT|nr:hypothetical protein FTUN_2306 [Frigoriglobus tundricola]